MSYFTGDSVASLNRNQKRIQMKKVLIGEWLLPNE
jgi:hypothetical protein